MPQLGEGHRRIGVRICESGVEAHRNGKGVGCRPERVEAEVRTAEVVWHGRVRGAQRGGALEQFASIAKLEGAKHGRTDLAVVACTLRHHCKQLDGARLNVPRTGSNGTSKV